VGLFDLFRGKKEGGAPSNAADKWTDRALDKRAQSYDRLEAIQALANLRTKEAAAVLLRRFNFLVDPSMADQEEKELALEGIVAAGPSAMEAVRAYSERAESIAWPMRVAKELLEKDEYVSELLEWLARFDTEYAKFIDPKLQLLAELGEYRGTKLIEAVLPFLEDVSEAARFNAVSTLLAQLEESASVDLIWSALLDHFPAEESVRIRALIADAVITREYAPSENQLAAMRPKIPEGYYLDGQRLIKF
jgi:hypothetical protein